MTTKLLAKDGEGERLDRFELIAELASGGMATVFLARLSGAAGFQRLVAIERLHPHLAREPEFVEMFLDEARLAARIHHPNVVPIQEVGESDQGYYLVMDYIEGDTLAHVLATASKAQTKVPYGVTIRILLDVLAGLHAAHQMKDDLGVPLEIVHRDVSPQNILVGVDGVARLVDFGVARAASRLSTTRSGQLKGKLAYMAPEQARGETIDRRADLFSCGIVLWEVLAMKRLFKSDGEAATLNRVLYEPLLPPSSVRSDVPKALEDLCMKALSREVGGRFATAQEFGDELERAARALSCVGSVRDVSQCLEEVMGADLSQQRDAVRSWLARSEPNQERSKGGLDSTVTRVDRGSKSELSERLRSGPPSQGVSSVSSAVLQLAQSNDVATLPAEAAAAARPAPAPRLAIPLVAVAIAAAVVVLVGVGAWGARSYRASNARPSVVTLTTSTPPASSVESAAPSIPSTPPPPDPGPAPSAAPSASSAGLVTSASAAPRPRRPSVRPGASARPAPVATPAPTAPGVPDDLSQNPYR